MLNRFAFIKEQLAITLIRQSLCQHPTKVIDSKTREYNVSRYIIIHKDNIHLTEYDTPPNEECFYTVMNEMMRLYEDRLPIVPILGYALKEETITTMESNHNVYSSGYIILPKIKGDILYDYNKSPNPFLNEPEKDGKRKANYLLARAKLISEIPNICYDEFAKNVFTIYDAGLKLDPFDQMSIMFDGSKFIFSRINHLSDKTTKMHKSNMIKACFLPCVSNYDFCKSLTIEQKQTLKNYNAIIFEKCKQSLFKLGVTEDIIAQNSKFVWR